MWKYIMKKEEKSYYVILHTHTHTHTHRYIYIYILYFFFTILNTDGRAENWLLYSYLKSAFQGSSLLFACFNAVFSLNQLLY